jgi:hypothetical protein
MQGEVVDNIEKNMSFTMDYVADAREELVEAREYKKKAFTVTFYFQFHIAARGLLYFFRCLEIKKKFYHHNYINRLNKERTCINVYIGINVSRSWTSRHF